MPQDQSDSGLLKDRMHFLVLLLSFSPDRPGFADSTETVSAGSVQMEFGLRSSFEDDATSLALPAGQDRRYRAWIG